MKETFYFREFIFPKNARSKYVFARNLPLLSQSRR